MADDQREGIVREVHQHGQFQRPGLIIHVSEEAAQQECRYSLPGVQMDKCEEEGGEHYGPDGLDAAPEETTLYHTAAEPFLEERCEDAHAEEVNPKTTGSQPLQGILQPGRHGRKPRDRKISHYAGGGLRPSP